MHTHFFLGRFLTVLLLKQTPESLRLLPHGPESVLYLSNPVCWIIGNLILPLEMNFTTGTINVVLLAALS